MGENRTSARVSFYRIIWSVHLVHEYQLETDTCGYIKLLSHLSCFWSGTVLYAAVGAVAALTLLVLVACVRKRRENSKPQPQVRSNSTDPASADEREVWHRNVELNTSLHSTTVFLEKHGDWRDSELNKADDDRVSFPGFRGQRMKRGFPDVHQNTFLFILNLWSLKPQLIRLLVIQECCITFTVWSGSILTEMAQVPL